MYIDTAFYISLFMLSVLAYLSYKIKDFLSFPEREVRRAYFSILLINIAFMVIYVETIVKRLLLTEEELFSEPVVKVTLLIQYLIVSFLMLLVVSLMNSSRISYAEQLYPAVYISFALTIIGYTVNPISYAVVSAIALIIFALFVIEVHKKINVLRENGFKIEAEALSFYLKLSLVFIIIVLGDIIYQRIIGCYNLFLDINLVLSTLTVILLSLSIVVNPGIISLYKKIRTVI